MDKKVLKQSVGASRGSWACGCLWRKLLWACCLLLCGKFAEAQVEVHGHRGARGHMPENSIPGFFRALELGAEFLEMDLVVSGDGQLVVSHEPWFAPDMCRDAAGQAPARRKSIIYKMTASQIADYDCGCVGDANFPKAKVMAVRKPTLQRVVAACDSFARVHALPPPHYNLEIKSRKPKYGKWQPQPGEFADLVTQEILQYQVAERILVQSFDRRILQEMRKRLPEVPLGLLVYDPRSLERHLKLLGFDPDYFNPYYKVLSKKMVEKAHEKGIRVVPWTVNAPEEMEKVIEMGVDGLITDFPDIATSLLHAL